MIMSQANANTTTNHPDATLIAEHLGELQPTACKYVGADEVLVSLTTKTGEIFSYSLKTAMLVHMVNLSTNLINTCTGQVFRDLGVF